MLKKCTSCITTSSPFNACHAFYKKRFHAHSLGMRMRELREARGLSQKQLADILDVDQSTVHRAEVMHPSAKLSTYIDVAKALGVTLEVLFNAYRDADEANLIEGFRNVPDPVKHSMLSLAKLGIEEGRGRADETANTAHPSSATKHP